MAQVATVGADVARSVVKAGKRPRADFVECLLLEDEPPFLS